MSYYVAKRNPENGKFELGMHEDKPKEYHSESEAIDMYKTILSLEGSNNVRLLESVILDVELTVKKWYGPAVRKDE